jgi:myo-inositol catabolism protein IolC
MTVGYDRPLYILPFDHRHSYGEDVFGYHEPMTPEQIASVAASKQVIYRGFQLAIEAGVPSDRAGILVDEEFGATILRDAIARGYITAMPTEKSGQHEFDFECGNAFAAKLDEFNPTFAKVLVRYNPEGDTTLNRRQLERLKKLSDYCRAKPRLFMFELLVPPEANQLEKVGGDHHAYDLNLRPELMVRAIREIQNFGVEPDVWKIEGLDRREDCERIVATVRRDGRDRVGGIVLGRGEDEQHVRTWLRVAATVPGFIGFAVGRSTFLEPIVSLRAGRLMADAAAAEISRRFRGWVSEFEGARQK